jgi:hypothetical protein
MLELSILKIIYYKFWSSCLDETALIHVVKNQILSFVIETIDKNCLAAIMNTIIFTNIFKNFSNLKYFNFDPSFTCDQLISFNLSPPTVFSSTLLTLHVKVASINDCLYLLDGRFNQLHTLYVYIELPFSRRPLKINNNVCFYKF